MREIVSVFLTVIASGAVIAQDSPFQPRPSRVVDGVAAGTATLSPDSVRVATVGRYRLQFTAGPGGIAMGGGILVDFPKAWFSNPVPLIKPVQTDDPAAPHYVSVSTSREGVELSLAIDHVALDGSIERYRHVMQVTVGEAGLRPRDTLTVTFANTTGPVVSGADHVRVAVDAEGDGTFKLLPHEAAYTIYAGDAAWGMLVAPSRAVAGMPVEIRLTTFDSLNNVVVGPDLNASVSVSGGQPVESHVLLSDGPRQWFIWTPKSAGLYWLTADDVVPVDPIVVQVTDTEAETKIYWGDIHSHTRVSKDGIGYGEFEYARDAARLDFYASSEHGGDDANIERAQAGDSISEK